MSNLTNFFENTIRQNRNRRVMKLGEKIARRFLTCYWNESYFDMRKNGEFYLIQSAQEHFVEKPKKVVFDVGANHGQWSIGVKTISPDAVIHCFEIVPQTFDILSEKLEAYDGIILNKIGLSDSAKEVEVTYFDEDSGSSIQPLPWQVNSTTVPCQVVSGDQYCQENHIDEIDFLKIDTEGHELSVLRGFNELLKLGKITLIQFEYGMTYIPSRVTLGDVYRFLSPYGYSIGRLYPMGVEFKQYDMFNDENFKLGNYVAVHQSAHRLLQRISL